MNLEKIIPRNQHVLERAVRILLGVVLLSLTVLGPETYWGLLGIIPLATGLLGSCPLYTLFGLSTCSTRGPKHPGPSRA